MYTSNAPVVEDHFTSETDMCVEELKAFSDSDGGGIPAACTVEVTGK